MSFVSPFSFAVIVIVLLSLFGLPIGLSMLGGSILYLLVTGQDIGIAAEQVLQGLNNSFTLLAIPLFILAAEIMNLGSLSDRLLGFCNALVGRFRGGLGHVNVVSAIIFSGMSGSAIADAVGLGRLIIKMMTKDGRYTPAYAAAITAASATIGPIIPPSIPLVLYALVSDTSIGYLFLGGVVPGLVMGVVLMAMNAVIARRRNFPVEPPIPLREMPALTLRARAGAVDAGGAARRHLWRRDDAHRGGGGGRAVRAGGVDRAVPLGVGARHLWRTAGQRPLDGLGRPADRRRAGVQLCRHQGRHPQDGERVHAGVSAHAFHVPAAGQCPAAGAGLPARRRHDPAGDRADPAADGQAAGHRHGALRSWWSPST